MNKLIVVVFSLYIAFGQTFAQNATFSFLLEEEPFPGFPALHSFVEGRYDGKWILIGGRTDGLHRRQPFAAFDPDFNNTYIYVADIATKQVWSTPLTGLPENFIEQLQSSNMEYIQRGSTLYITGGYGYSPSADEWVTYPYLTAIDLAGLTQAIIENNAINPHFRYLMDERVRVTGGYMHLLNDVFYLAGGQIFEGRYNPMGPNHGPGFFQEYTNAIRKFKIDDDGNTLTINDFEEIIDTANLHRRDYNMTPQIFPDGSRGFTMFSGVFQYDQDLPWLNTVDVFPDSYVVNNNFNQYLNQYHTAHTSIFSETLNQMHTVFFGGISRYTLNSDNVLIDDPEVPFVKTISLVTRSADGSMQEFKLGEMPGLLGSGATFLPAPGLPVFNDGILKLDELPDEQVIGYIFGGIESTLPNILFIDNGTLSDASGKVFKVTLQKQTTNVVEISGEQYFGLRLFPNPNPGKLTVNFSVPVNDTIFLTFRDASGKKLKEEKRTVEFGEYELHYDVSTWAGGTYFLELKNGLYSTTRKFLKD